MKNKPIIIVTGEPKSIFFEIFFKAIKRKKYKSPIILICCKKILINQMKKNNYKKKFKILKMSELKNYKLKNNEINLINVECKQKDNNFVAKLNNEYLRKSFDLALKIIKNNISYKMINGPVNKKSFLQKKFLGITEYISKKYKVKNTGMLIYNKKLSVCPLTTHLPIKLVAKNITKKFVEEKIQIINSFYKTTLKYKPNIGVTGLNPHCESILSFNEDENIIIKAVRSQKNKGVNVKGPYPADTIFLRKNRKKFDVILGMYHDQVLTPAKVIFEFDAINITMGLPFLRVTPDHGPNEKMIGKNMSNPTSLINALNFLDKN